MKTRTRRKNKVHVVTLGCSKNVVDSEVLMAQLKANQFDVEHDRTDGDAPVVVVNTCGFIESAKQESIETILQFVEAKRQGRVEKVYVTGCLSERYRADLEKEIPEVDSFFGTRDLPRLLKTLRADYKHALVGEQFLTTPGHFAYFKISEGCDRVCSFCAIPLMRGKHVSVPMEDLVARAAALAQKGTRELILIAQDLTSYGVDLYGKRNLAELLDRLADVKGIDWIRLHYAFPSGFPLDALEPIRERTAICKYLDMPVQHISDTLLKSMRRGLTRKKTIELIDTIREKVPGIALRTTLIAGYPGETDRDHEELLGWLEQTRFDRLGVFTYSHEENTHAFARIDDVPPETKQDRADAILQVQRQISHELNHAKIGRTLKVLFDRKENGCLIGRTESDSPEVDNEVRVDHAAAASAGPPVGIGEFADVLITSADDYDLVGTVQ